MHRLRQKQREEQKREREMEGLVQGELIRLGSAVPIWLHTQLRATVLSMTCTYDNNMCGLCRSTSRVSMTLICTGDSLLAVMTDSARVLAEVYWSTTRPAVRTAKTGVLHACVLLQSHLTPFLIPLQLVRWCRLQTSLRISLRISLQAVYWTGNLAQAQNLWSIQQLTE